MATIIDQKVKIEFVEDVEPQPVKDGEVLVDAAGEIQRLPVPSADPNDPLNFTLWEKTGVIVSCCWFSIMSLSVVGGLGSILGIFFGLYMPQGYSTTQVVWLGTFPSLFVGVGECIERLIC
jgi:hypothetical protein